MRIIRAGDRGDEVRDVQSRLSALGHRIDQPELEEDRFAGSTESAVREFQQDRGLVADGLVGEQTWRELVEAGYGLGDRVLYLRIPHFRGDDVLALQRRLNTLGFDPAWEDGIFGEQTAVAVTDFQRNVGLNPDGIVGATTLEALSRLRASVAGPGRAAVRESESIRERGSLQGRSVAVDAGHSPADPGHSGPGGLLEHEATFVLAERLAEELETRGATPVVLREGTEEPPMDERVARANASEADAVISLHLGGHADPTAEGASTCYFGLHGSISVAGQALAEHVQDEITSRLGLADGRTHPKAYPMLRETRMPAVHVEPCFITNPREERLLAEGKLPHDLAIAIADALDRFFAGRADEG